MAQLKTLNLTVLGGLSEMTMVLFMRASLEMVSFMGLSGTVGSMGLVIIKNIKMDSCSQKPGCRDSN